MPNLFSLVVRYIVCSNFLYQVSSILRRLRRSFKVGIGFVEASYPEAGGLAWDTTPLRRVRAQRSGVPGSKILQTKETLAIRYTGWAGWSIFPAKPQ